MALPAGFLNDEEGSMKTVTRLFLLLALFALGVGSYLLLQA